ncbi:CsiV family protein [Galenea microaerophila]
MKSFTATLIALSLSAFAFNAQSAPQDPSEQPPLYQVEIIVFETTALRGWTEEFWPHQVPEIPTDNAYPIQPGVVLVPPADQTPIQIESDSQVQVIGVQTETLQAESLDTTQDTDKDTAADLNERTADTVENRTHAFLLAPDDSNSDNTQTPSLWLLNTEASKLVPSKGYRILLHQSWVQEGLPPSQAQPIYFENEPQSEYQSALTGTVKLYKTRYAHIETHFNLERFIPTPIREKFAQHEDIDADQMPDYWTFQLQQARKIKPGQLHYIDHPLFGILMQIKRLKPEQLPLYQSHAVSQTVPLTTP